MAPLFALRGCDVYARDVALLAAPGWLNDTCIHFALLSLQEAARSEKPRAGAEGRSSPSFQLLDPSIVSFLRLQVQDDDEYDELRSSLRLNTFDWTFLPINDNTGFDESSTHWSLVICHVPSASAFALDSSSNYNLRSARALMPKLARLLGVPAVDLVPLSCPQQSNSYDCGVYVVIFAEKMMKIIAEAPFSTRSCAQSWTRAASARLLADVDALLPTRTRERLQQLASSLTRPLRSDNYR